MHQRGTKTLIFIVNYFAWLIYDYTNLLVFWELYIYITEIGDGDVKRASRVDRHEFFDTYARMSFGHFLMENVLY